MYLTSGQLPRSPELVSLRYKNGPCTPRGIYVYNGYMIYLVRHHKAKRTTNREFIVARYLPVQIGHLLYKYLVFVRLFIENLTYELGLNADTYLSFLFNTVMTPESKLWATSQLTKVIKHATDVVWNQAITSQMFRQICIGITEKYIR
jgi:hypothetical protein